MKKRGIDLYVSIQYMLDVFTVLIMLIFRYFIAQDAEEVKRVVFFCKVRCLTLKSKCTFVIESTFMANC